MGATNTNTAMPGNFDLRQDHIARVLNTLTRSRKALGDVTRVLTAPIVDHVADVEQAIERIKRLQDLPLPEFDKKDEE